MNISSRMRTFVYALCIGGINSLHAQAPNMVIDTIPTSSFQAGASLNLIAISRDGSTAYVPDAAHNTVYTIRTSDFVVTGTVSDPHSILQDPQYIAITPDGTKAYISNVSSSHYSVGILDITSNSITGSITGSFNFPIGIAFTPNGNIAYIANNNGASVNVVDVIHDTVVSTLTGSFNKPSFIATSPVGTKAYVSNLLGNNVSIVMNNAVTGTVGGAFVIPEGIAITPNGSTAYVANATANRVNIVDVVSNVVTGTVSAVAGAFHTPFLIAITPDGTMAYVTNRNGSAVSIIDLVTNMVTSTVSVGTLPNGLAITPNGQEVWVVNAGDDSISIIGSAISSPTQVRGCKTQNAFLTQTEYVNVLTWQPPTRSTAVKYVIYRDAALTDVAGTVLATANPLQFLDRNRNPRATYTYYIVAFDAAGNSSPAAVITVTQACPKK